MPEIPTDEDFPYRWRVRTRLPDRYGQRCRVTARGRLNSIRVEFDDRVEVVTSRWYVRRIRNPSPNRPDG